MEDLESLSNGSNFARADLHIHSYGNDGSFDVNDPQMTPQNIVDTAITNNLSIISITDHNEISNSKIALDYANGKSILVIPGIEVSTIQGHLLVYFETFQNLRAFFGKLTISEDKERCSQGIVECLNFAKEFGGVGVLAHIELNSGFEKTIGRFSNVIKDIFIHPTLLALEISKKINSYLYTDSDESNDRRLLLNARRESLNLPADYILPKLMSSDSHALDKLGRNAEGNNKLTRIKVDTLNFSAFRNALICYESRIRLEDFLPNKIPYIAGICIKGGILDSQSISLSKNLTCIIGGRGTGKSTLLESIREGTGNRSSAKIVNTEVWPDEINLIFEDETGMRTHFRREKNDDTFNLTDSNGISSIDIESYGQGETADTIQHSDKNPKILLDFLDEFIDVKMIAKEDSEVCELLLENQSSLGKARVDIKSIPDIKTQIASLEGKKQRLEKDKVGDLVKYQTSLITERGIRQTLVEELKALIKKYRDVLGDNDAFDYFSNLSNESIVIGVDEFDKVKEIVLEFSSIVSSKSDELNDTLNNKIEELKVQLESWKSKESEIQKKIDEKKKELEEQGIPFDIGKINQIAKDLDHYKTSLRKLQDTEKSIIKLEQERKALIDRRKGLKTAIYNQRLAFSVKINENLKNSVDGLLVSAKYIQGCHSPSFENSLKQLMEWRTAAVPKAQIIAEHMSPMEFADNVKRNNLNALLEIINEDRVKVFNASDISNILEKTRQNHSYEDFEALEFEDRPKLSVTKVVENAQGKKINVTKSLANLSLGQQQSILLSILLQSNSTNPLLIDQPEDNLDSEFIYKSIVSCLKKIKEKRQIIIVTHNPNIAVLGDAELIVPLKSTSTSTKISDRGSIDKLEIRNLCCDILEGGKLAFINRQKLYGFSS